MVPTVNLFDTLGQDLGGGEAEHVELHLEVGRRGRAARRFARAPELGLGELEAPPCLYAAPVHLLYPRPQDVHVGVERCVQVGLE